MSALKKKNDRRAPSAKIELLEARVLYSADLTGSWTDVASDLPVPEDNQLLDGFVFPANSEITTLVFIDTRTPDYDFFLQQLNKDSPTNLQVVLLDKSQSGVDQISKTLDAHSNIQSVHFVSHNIDDGIALGSDVVDAEFVSRHTSRFNEWSSALTPDADLLFYGCNLAVGDSDELIQLLASSTGADIAASDNLTGSATLYPERNADWELEVSSGSIETELFLAEGVLNNWKHTLGTITVTTPTDQLDAAALNITDLQNNRGGDNEISLREAIIAANRTPGPDTIVLDAETYTLLWAGDGTAEDAALQDDLDITDELTIIGKGSDVTSIDGNNNFRVLETHNTSLTLEGLNIKGGLVSGPDNGGGLMINGGTTTLSNVAVSSNKTQNSGVGAGIYVGTATLNMTDSVVELNQSSAEGGGLYITGTAIIKNSEISNNTSVSDGAGIRNYGTLELDGVFMRNNVTQATGGGITSNGTTTILNSTFELNHSNTKGGALSTDSAITLAIENSTFLNNSSDSDGGALNVANSNLSVTHSTFSQNSADGKGGAIHLSNPASALINNSIFADNAATSSHPAIEQNFTSGFNLVDTTVNTGNFNGMGDMTGATANLAPLADNGGPVPTMALLAGSDAIDSGQGAQRRDATGVLSNEFVDIGAFEYRTPSGGDTLRKIFWTDNTDDAIYRANEDASHQLSAVQQILATARTPEDLEFDEATKRIYWVEGTGTSGRVLSADVDGRNSTTLLSSTTHPELVVIHGIAVDADTNLIYVTSDAATAASGTTDKIIAYELNDTGDAIISTGTIVAEGTASSGTRMYEVYDVEVGTNPVTGHTQLLWADRGDGGSQVDKGYRHWNLTNGAKGKTPYGGGTGGSIDQPPTSVAWNFNENSYYQTDSRTYQNITVDPITMNFAYNGASDNPSTASGLAYDAETDTLWVSETGSGSDSGRIFTANPTITDGSEVSSLTNVNSPRALALASISRVSIAPIVTENTGAVLAEGSRHSIVNTELRTSDADDLPADLIFTIVTAPLHGFVSLNSNLLTPITTFTQEDIDNGRVIYSHDDSENFTDQFDFEVTDGVEIIDSNTFTININKVNDNFPQTQNAIMDLAEGDIENSITYGTPAVITNDLNDLVTDSDVGDDTTFSIETTTTFGTLTINPNGTFQYIHDGTENFTDSFVYAVEDLASNRSTGTVNITIAPANDSTPVAVADSIIVDEGGSIATLTTGQNSVLFNDSDADLPNDTLTTTILVNPTNGSLTFYGDGTFLYQHNDSENHNDGFEYTVEDAAGNKDSVLVDISINPINDHSPVTNNATIAVDEGDTATSVTYGTPSLTTTDLNDLVTDTDTGDTTTFSTETTTSFGTLTINPNGTFEYIHNGSENFTDSFVYAVTDSNNNRSTGTVSIAVTPVNDSNPVGHVDSITVTEGDFVSILTTGQSSVLTNDTDGDLPYDSLGVSVFTAPAFGTLSLNPDGSFVYQHDGSENHIDGFVYTLEDAVGNTDTVTVNITVTPVNDNAPATTNADMAVSEGGTSNSITYGTPSSVTADLNDLVTDSDSADTTTFSTDTTTAFGTLSISPGGTFEYIHDGSENFTDSFIYAVTDSNNNRSTGTVNITISPINDSIPVGAVDSIIVTEGDFATTLTTGQNSVLSNDTDNDLPNDTLIASILNAPAFGFLTLNPNGSFNYQHDDTENHSDSFEYTLEDAVGNTDTVQVNIDVTPINDNAPDTRDATMTVNEGNTSTSITYGTPASVTTDLNDLVTDQDPGDSTTFTTDTTTAFGTLSINPDGTFEYTHDGSENFTDSFIYAVTDSNSQRSTGTVSITVNPINDSTPVGTTDSITVAEGAIVSTLTNGASSVLANDADSDLPYDTLEASILNAPAFGLLTLNTNGSFSYQHDGSENHSDSFEYTLEDAVGNTDTVLVSIDVTPINDNTPVAQDASMTVSEGGTAISITHGISASATDDLNELVTDSDSGDSTTFSIDTIALFGSLIINPNGTFEYIHDGSENFSDSFIYAVTDSDNHRSTGTVDITVIPVNDSIPVGTADSITVAEGGFVTKLATGQTTVLANDTDNDLPNDTLVAAIQRAPDFGSLTLNPDGSFHYQHDDSENFTDSFEYTLEDAVGNSDAVLVNIAITRINDNTPVTLDGTMTVSEGGTDDSLSFGTPAVITTDLNDLVTDIDPGDSTTFSIDTTTAFGALTINPDGTFAYIHDGTEHFTDSFVYAVEDSNNHRSTGFISITVDPVNDHSPVVPDDKISVDEGGTTAVFSSGRSHLLEGLIDPDTSDTATVSLLTDVSHGRLVINPDNSFNYQHNGSENFSDTFVYSVSDAVGQTDIVTIEINIAPVNDPPAGTNKTLTIIEDTVQTLSVNDFGFTDPSENNNFESIVISSAPSSGQLKLNGTNVETGASVSTANISTGQLTYHPAANLNGVNADAFKFQVVDDGTNTGAGQNTDPTPKVIIIDINAVNDSPTALSNEISQSVVQRSAYEWPLPAELFEDVDGDILILDVTRDDGTPLPDWLTYDQFRGTLSGVPEYSDVGTLKLSVIARDVQGLTATVPLNLTVTETNAAPLTVTLSNHSVAENQPGVVVGDLTVDDIDTQDTHNITVNDSRFIITNGTLRLIPGTTLDFETEPQIDLILTTTDSAGNTIETTLQLSVLDANESPVPDNTDIEASGSAPFSLTLPADFFIDEDDDPLTYSATLADGSPLPDWISFNPVDRSIAISENAPNIESVALSILASDGDNASASETLTVVLQPIAAAATPVIDSVSDTGFNEPPVEDPRPPGKNNNNRIEPAAENNAPPLDSPVAPQVTLEIPDTATALQIDPVVVSVVSPVAYQLAPSRGIEPTLQTNEKPVNQTPLQNEVIQPLSKLFLEDSLEFDQAYSSLVSALDIQRDAQQEQQIRLQQVVATSIATTSGLTVGYIAWLLRGGILLSSVLSSLPAWRLIDPLPVLNKMHDDEETDDESLESMVDSDPDSQRRDDLPQDKPSVHDHHR